MRVVLSRHPHRHESSRENTRFFVRVAMTIWPIRAFLRRIFEENKSIYLKVGYSQHRVLSNGIVKRTGGTVGLGTRKNTN